MKLPTAKLFIFEEDREWMLQRIREATSACGPSFCNYNKELAPIVRGISYQDSCMKLKMLEHKRITFG